MSLTGGLDFPGELFDADWYADAYPELELTRELPRETRFIGSIQHYLRVGRRQPRMRRRASRYRVLRATASWPTSSAGR